MEPEAATVADAAVVFLSLARRSSLRESISRALEKEGSTIELAMLLAVPLKRGLWPLKPGILDGFADVPKSGGRELEFQAVLIDRRVTLLQGVKLLNQEDSPGCAVGAEEAFNGHPQLAGGLVLIGEGQVKNGVIDSVQDPTADGALSNVPRWINRRRSRPSDVWEKTEFPTQGLEERSRLGEVGGFSSPRPPGCGSSHWR